MSVLLLGVVAWDGAKDKPLLTICLVAGMATSIIGMFCRWLSYQKKEEPPQQAHSGDWREPARPRAGAHPLQPRQ